MTTNIYERQCKQCSGIVENVRGVPQCESCGATQHSQQYGQTSHRVDTSKSGLSRSDGKAAEIDKSARRHDSGADPDTDNRTTWYSREPSGKPATDGKGEPISEEHAEDMSRRWQYQGGNRSGANTRHREWRRFAESKVNSLGYPSHVAQRVGELIIKIDMRIAANKCRHRDYDNIAFVVIGLIGYVVWGSVDRALSSFNRHGKSLTDNPKVLEELGSVADVKEAVSYAYQEMDVGET